MLPVTDWVAASKTLQAIYLCPFRNKTIKFEPWTEVVRTRTFEDASLFVRLLTASVVRQTTVDAFQNVIWKIYSEQSVQSARTAGTVCSDRSKRYSIPLYRYLVNRVAH